jgi:hypothetical protein
LFNFKKPVVIVCATNSGSKCLLHSLLEHPQLGGLRMELHWFGLAPNLPGRMDRLFSLWPCFPTNYMDENPPRFGGTGPYDKNSVEYIIKKAYQCIPEKNRKDGERLLIKEPKFALRLKWLRKIWPDCKIIVLVRNPWSVCEGIKRKLPLMGDVPSHIDIPTACAQWINTYSCIRVDSAKIHNVYTVRYEDMIRAKKFPCGENGTFWTRLLEFCELDEKGFSIPNESKYSHFTGERDGFSLGLLSQWEKDFISEAAAHLIESYGYNKHLAGEQ